MQRPFAKYIIAAAFVASTVIADPTIVTVFEHVNFEGISHRFDSHNDCILLPEAFRTIVSSFTRDKHWYKVRLWQGAKCEGENQAYQESFFSSNRQWKWDFVGHKMNDKVVSVSTCKESFHNECYAIKSSMLATTAAAAAGSLCLGPISLVIGGTIAAVGEVVAWTAFYNGDCRFCTGRLVDDHHLFGNAYLKKRDVLPDTPSACVTRNFEGERTILTDMSKAASSTPLTPPALSDLVASYFPGGIADTHLESVAARFTQAIMETADTNADGAVDSKEMANLLGIWLTTINE